MLWDGRYGLIELHLDRLGDSADYFGFHLNKAAVRSVLLDEAALFPDQRSRKVRLLLDCDGAVRIEAEIIPNLTVAGPTPPRVCIADERTNPNDRFLFHKTTNRTLYNSCLAAASRVGFADVLFLNERGEVTEGANNNVLIEKDGRWYTPPVSCGVLPGVYRRYLLQTRPEIEEKILTLEDIGRADDVYICNAVRGLRRVGVSLT
jgi:para-aminobenzoate synthetase/4-amino-4-deoxychorismate lyase